MEYSNNSQDAFLFPRGDGSDVDTLKQIISGVLASLNDIQGLFHETAIKHGGLRLIKDRVGLLATSISSITNSWSESKLILHLSKEIQMQFPQLTTSEAKVAAHIANGHKTSTISLICSISERTVLNHRMHIRKKIGVTGMVNLRTLLLKALR